MLLRQYPVVAILGARQVGKTTLAKQLLASWPGETTAFDLEDPQDQARLADPSLSLRPLRGLVVLDEIHRSPDLFPILRVLADRPRTPARFLILGSASIELLRQGSETLAGRIAFHELPGLSLDEVGPKALDRRWLRGGFPRSYLARTESESLRWRREFVATFLERDIPSFGIRVPSPTLARFWSMLAHYHGQVVNFSELGRAFGITDNTVRHYLDILTATFVVRQLQPWAANISKRQVKSPKVYVADSGLLHSLLDIEDRGGLDRHPKIGASWEGFLLETVIQQLGARRDQCFFWATHAGAELDLLVSRGNRRIGFEFKRTAAPRITPSMRAAVADLGLHRLDLVHAGDHTFPLAPRIRAVAAAHLLQEIR